MFSMFDGKVKSKEHLKLGRSVRSAKIGAQARAAIAKVKSVETQHVRPTLRATAATTETEIPRQAPRQKRRSEGYLLVLLVYGFLVLRKSWCSLSVDPV